MIGPSRGGTLKDAKTVMLSRTANSAKEMRGTRGLLAAAARAADGAPSRIEAAAAVAKFLMLAGVDDVNDVAGFGVGFAEPVPLAPNIFANLASL